MDDKTYFSSLGEMKVITDLTEKGYHVFNQISGKAPFDVVAYKNQCLRISIKSCNLNANKVGNYTVQIKRVRSNKTENKIYKFNREECDYIAVYIVEIDSIFYYDVDDLISLNTITVNPNKDNKQII